MREVFRTADAEADFIEVWSYIASDNEQQADALLDKLEKLITRLAEYPGIGSLRPEIADGVRSAAIGNYVLFYTHTDTRLTILRLLHGARNIRDLFGR